MSRALSNRCQAAAAALLALGALFSPAPTAAQQGADEIIEELEGLLRGLSGSPDVDPEALVRAELPVVLETSGMTARGPISTRMVDRDGAAAHVAAVMAAQLPPERLLPMDFAWKALGLIEADSSLGEAIAGLYTSQAGGFYDPASGQLVLLSDTPALLQGPVVRHELVHALQDQNYDLQRWIGDAAEDEDRGAAIQAVLEGHAMDVMNRATMAGLQLDVLLQDPDLAQSLEGLFDADTLGQSGGGGAGGLYSSMLPADTPPVLVAQLLFPYFTGATFVSGYRAAHPEDPACEGLYARPPRTTAEVLDPSLWEAGGLPSILAKPGTGLPGFEAVWSTSLGRLVAWVLLTGQGDPSAGDPRGGHWNTPNRDRSVVVGSGWRGDRVAVFAPGGTNPGTGVPDSSVVVWTSQWSTAAEAEAVAERLRERTAGATIDVRKARVQLVVAPAGVDPGAWLDAISGWR